MPANGRRDLIQRLNVKTTALIQRSLQSTLPPSQRLRVSPTQRIAIYGNTHYPNHILD